MYNNNTVNGLGVAPLVVALAPAGVKFATSLLKNLFGAKPKGEFFNWDGNQQSAFMTDVLDEAFSGKYMSPYDFWAGAVTPVLEGDYKNSTPALFWDTWNSWNNNIPAKDYPQRYKMSWYDATQLPDGTPRPASMPYYRVFNVAVPGVPEPIEGTGGSTSSGNPLQAGISGWLPMLLMGGAAVSAVVLLLMPSKKKSKKLAAAKPKTVAKPQVPASVQQIKLK